MLLVLGALGIGYGFRGWYLYYNDRDQYKNGRQRGLSPI